MHLFWRLHVLNVHAGDQNARLVQIQLRLNRFHDVARDGFTLFVEHHVHGALAHHLAHGRLRRLDDRQVRLHVVKQIVRRVLQAVLHHKAHVHNVFVLREHGGVAQTGALRYTGFAHFHRAQLTHAHHFVLLDRVGQAPVKACAGDAFFWPFEFAKAGDDGLLSLLHDVKARAQPYQHDHAQNQADSDACALHVGLKAAAIARAVPAPPIAALAIVCGATRGLGGAEQTAQLAVEITPEFVQIGRALLGSPRTGRVALGWFGCRGLVFWRLCLWRG